MKYRYTLSRELFVVIEIEADDEDQAQEIYESQWYGSSRLDEMFASEMTSVGTEVCEVECDGRILYLV